jgi:hypothetical protein
MPRIIMLTIYIVSHQAFIIDPLVIIQPSRTYKKQQQQPRRRLYSPFLPVNTGVMNTHNGLHFVQQLRLFFISLSLGCVEYTDLQHTHIPGAQEL